MNAGRFSMPFGRIIVAIQWPSRRRFGAGEKEETLAKVENCQLITGEYRSRVLSSHAYIVPAIMRGRRKGDGEAAGR
jgi:hypothetical protein